MKEDKSKLIALVLVIVTIIVVIISAVFVKEETKEEKITIVTNYTKFYTVNSCLSRYINYLSSNDIESLLLILNDKYKEDNNISKENVLEHLGKLDENANFISKKMYYVGLPNNVEKYYVYGQLGINQIYDGEILQKDNYKDIYFIVYMDFKNKVFSIEPYSGDVFIGGENNE